MDFAIALDLYTNILLTDSTYLQILKSKIKYILVDNLEEAVPAQIDFLKKMKLVVGLGNRDATPDSLGPRTVEKLNIFTDKAWEIQAIAPGVMAQTGMETASIIKAIVKEMKIQNLITGDDNFLEAYIGQILVVKEAADSKLHNKKIEMADGEKTNTKRNGVMKTELVEKIRKELMSEE